MFKTLYLLLAMAYVAVAGAADVPAAEEIARLPAVSGQSRTLHLQGAPNFRDIGGYTTEDARHVRWGLVFRSGELSRLTPEDAHQVERLKLAAVVDLRTAEERNASSSVWIDRPSDVYESPKPTLAPLMQTVLKDSATADGIRTGMKALYVEMPDSYRTEYSAMFHRIAAGDLPILIHCTGGKVRTGVAIALLLATIGVPRQTVVADYAMSDKLIPAPGATTQQPASTGGISKPGAVLAQLPLGSRRVLWRSDADYILAALDAIDREYGSTDDYVRRGLGVSDAEIRTLRSSLTE